MRKLGFMFSTIRFSLLVLNILFALTGIIVIITGGVVFAEYNQYQDLLNGQFFLVPVFLMSIGGIIFLVSFFGFLGAYKQNYHLIIVYAVFMVIVCCLELAAGISGFVLRNSAIETVKGLLLDAIAVYGKTYHDGVTLLWDEIQQLFQCCGVTGINDWFPVPGGIPLSCCQIQSGIIDQFRCTSSNAFGYGCGTEFGYWVENHAHTLGLAGIIICCIQVLAIVGAVFLARKSKRERM